MRIISLEQNHVKSVINISNEVFGKDFLTNTSINEYLNSPNKFAWVSLNLNKEVTAYILTENLSFEKLKMLSDNLWFSNYFKTYKKITLINQIAVNPAFQKKGIGDNLITHFLNQVDNLSEIICCLAWKQDNNTPLEKILLKNDFSFIKSIANYWLVDSIKKHYNCSSCGSPPCKCGADVYAK